jgi:hypothetical protein
MESGEGSAPAGDGQPAPGWYPDPVDSTGLRYWDGRRWTVEQAPKGSPVPQTPGAETPPHPPTPLRTPARFAIVALVVAGLVNLVYLVIAIRYSDEIDAALNGNGPTVGEAQDITDAFGAVSGVYGLSVLIAAITFLVWFFRAYRNGAALTGSPLRFSPGWSVGAWFVPFLNLWRPKQIANDVWRAGDPKAGGNPGWHSLPVAGFVHWWWALWLLAGLVSSVGGLMLSPDPVLVDFVAGISDVSRSDLETERAAATVLAASAAFEVIAASAAIIFVHQASARQDELISGGGASQAPSE